MRITEGRLRSIIRSVLKESVETSVPLGKGYGCEVYGESIDFDSFVLKIVTKMRNQTVNSLFNSIQNNVFNSQKFSQLYFNSYSY